MSVYYKVLPCVNPAGAEGTDYAACRETKSGVIELSELAEEINNATSVTISDVKGIIAAFQTQVNRHIKNGNPVLLDELGTFRAKIKSRCFPQSAISADDFNPSSYIERCDLRFTATVELRRHVKEFARFKRVPSDLMA